MKNYVLDTFAIMAYFENEEGAVKVADVFEQALAYEANTFLSVINWGEMYYISLREGGKEKAELYKHTLQRYPIEIVEANKELTLLAAQYKANNKMSYADAFATGLAKLKKGILVTGDIEFKSIEKDVKILWI